MYELNAKIEKGALKTSDKVDSEKDIFRIFKREF